MATVFIADKDVKALVHSVRDEYCPHLKGIDATVLFVMAKTSELTGEPRGPALRSHGYPAQAVIKICNPQEYALTKAEVIIKIDGAVWTKLTQEQRIALIHHQWCHVGVVRNNRGYALTDNNGRARIFIKRHDFQIAGFNEVIAAHGEASQELIQIQEVLAEGSPARKSVRQLLLFNQTI